MVAVQRVLTESDGKVEKNTVILGEEKGEITFVVEGRDVERVAAILYCCEIYQRGWRFHRSRHGFHFLTRPRDKSWKAMLSFLLSAS